MCYSSHSSNTGGKSLLLVPTSRYDPDPKDVLPPNTFKQVSGSELSMFWLARGSRSTWRPAEVALRRGTWLRLGCCLCLPGAWTVSSLYKSLQICGSYSTSTHRGLGSLPADHCRLAQGLSLSYCLSASGRVVGSIRSHPPSSGTCPSPV